MLLNQVVVLLSPLLLQHTIAQDKKGIVVRIDQKNLFLINSTSQQILLEAMANFYFLSLATDKINSLSIFKESVTAKKV